MEAPFIQLRNVWKSFEEQVVLAGISVDINRGETLGILGRSGTGKSVTLMLISGLLACDQGEVLIDGENIVGKTEVELLSIRKRISYVFQAGALFDSLTIYENIAYPLLDLGKHEDGYIKEKVNGLAQLLNVHEHLNQYPSEITLGTKKRVAIARALATEPEALLFDEPTTGLDALMGKRISKIICNLNKTKNLTSIVVTHDINCIEIVSDKVAMLDGGHIRFLGTFEQLRASSDEFIQEFLYGKKAFTTEKA
jgi:phospholipid/cholesterol/gamma-HCH transport system ATP-binding protein